jgi:hypothetical protein
MKFILLILGVGLLATGSLPAQITNGAVHLQWNYSSNALNEAQSYPPSFLIRGTNTLGSDPLTWPVVVNQPWTNVTVAGFDGSNYLFSTPFQVTPPGQMYFVATESNFWGESGLSNTSSTPALPSILQTRIFKN